MSNAENHGMHSTYEQLCELNRGNNAQTPSAKLIIIKPLSRAGLEFH